MRPVGFVGVGHLGAHLAASVLRAGYPLTVHDRSPDAAADLLAAGAAWAASPREVAEQCERVITCLPSPAAVGEVVAGADGLLAGLTEGSTWIDTSTTIAASCSGSRLSSSSKAAACSRLR